MLYTAGMTRCMPALLLILPLLYLPAAAQTKEPTSPAWQMQNSNTKASFRGVHAVGQGIAWVSGTSGTVLRTEDGGYLWQTCSTPPGAEKLDFRGIWAWDANTAIVMSSGPGEQSRIYKTTDGCHSWALLSTNQEKEGFWDAIQFWDQKNGALLGDPVAGHFTIGITKDGGSTWDFSTLQGPEVQTDTQAAFAASNTSMALGRTPWTILFATGGKGGARLYTFVPATSKKQHSPKWRQISIPVVSGTESSGVFSLALRDENHGVAVGGNYQKPQESAETAAWTANGGQVWAAAPKPPHGYRSAVAWDKEAEAWITVGSNGSDVSYDGGKSWESLDNQNWNALSLPWVVGPNGRIGKLVSLKGKTAAR